MNVLTKIALFGTLLITAPTLANPAQIAVAKKAVLAGEVMPYATPELRSLLKQAYRVDGQMTTPDNDMGCEFAEHFYLGHGNGGLEAEYIRNWKATTLKNGVIRISFSQAGFDGGLSDSNLIEFVMKGNQIHDVRFGYSDNPKKPPTKTDSSLRAEAQQMVKTGRCAWE